ncbi:MFS transporter [Zafaria sp. J156]|uniref:MFS transporter n=1 Tax=Zafaria sp. J156 TaxID=3116490 RepID=UPI002E794FC7|nr:MFS transporter [Zafaria sp. J156]MEE1620815.1 MFS transporter [Zafaria sp. J156]
MTARSSFRSLRSLAGTVFFPLALVARLPLAMLTIGALTLVTATTGSYASGGVAAGAVGVGSALGAPAFGYVADRVGQRPVLLPLAIVHAAAVAALIAAALGLAAPALVAALAVAAGASCPQVGPMARVRWMALTAERPHGRKELETALSYESTVDEITFVLGPALVGLLAAAIAPWLPLALAAGLTLVLVPAFALHRTAASVRPHRGTAAGQSDAARSAAAWNRGRTLRVGTAVAGMIGMGTIFGSLSAGAVAFAGAQGDSNAGGLLYAALGLTSAAAALSVAVWPTAWTQHGRWIACAALLLPATLLLQLPDSTPAMVAALMLVGLPVGPVMVAIFTLGGDVAPRGRLGTVMTLLASGIVVGTAIGNTLAGLLAEDLGHHGAMGVASAAAGFLLLCGVAMRVGRPGRRRAARAEHRSAAAS